MASAFFDRWPVVGSRASHPLAPIPAGLRNAFTWNRNRMSRFGVGRCPHDFGQ